MLCMFEPLDEPRLTQTRLSSARFLRLLMMKGMGHDPLPEIAVSSQLLVSHRDGAYPTRANVRG
jgi:hypothetical protein